VRLRIAIVALGLGIAVTGVVWLSLQPLLTTLLDTLRREGLSTHPAVAKVTSLLPFWLALDVAIAGIAIFLALELIVASPLRKAEQTVEQISRLQTDIELPSAGPVTSRLQLALSRLATALESERTRNSRQLEELRAANDRLSRLQAELVASDRLATVGKLAAGVAHEVGNPLAGILGYVSVLQSRAAGAPETLDVLRRIEHEVQRIDGIVRSLLELGRPSRGKAGPLDVSVVVQSSVKLLAAGRDFREVQVSVDCPASTFLCAEGGPLAQVLVNLLLNAAQAMKGHGSIDLRGWVEGDRGYISVADRGPGLSVEVQKHLFEPFFTTRPAGEGTGLGLAMSQHLLAQFDGRLTAAPREGGGAIFTISLPVP
jgi:two-component system NtrC family sensor kinase